MPRQNYICLVHSGIPPFFTLEKRHHRSLREKFQPAGIRERSVEEVLVPGLGGLPGTLPGKEGGRKGVLCEGRNVCVLVLSRSAGLLLGRTERAARAAELQLCAQAR